MKNLLRISSEEHDTPRVCVAATGRVNEAKQKERARRSSNEPAEGNV